MKYLIYLLAMSPLLWVAPEIINAIDPYDKGLELTGTWMVVWLAITIILGPLGRMFKKRELFYGKQPLGLAAASWSILHVLVYFLFHQSGFGVALLDTIIRPYLVLGLVAFAMLMALAVTSHKLMIRLLGKRWNILHSTVGVIATLAASHGLVAQKVSISEMGIMSMLLLAAVGIRYKTQLIKGK